MIQMKNYYLFVVGSMCRIGRYLWMCALIQVDADVEKVGSLL
jgi:hypothetical protein